MRIAHLPSTVVFHPRLSDRRESLPAPATGPPSGTKNENTKGYPSTRLPILALARFFDWREALTVVKPETFLKWHRTGFKLFWRWKSRHPGRHPLPKTSASC
jgi:hypothetical protein